MVTFVDQLASYGKEASLMMVCFDHHLGHSGKKAILWIGRCA